MCDVICYPFFFFFFFCVCVCVCVCVFVQLSAEKSIVSLQSAPRIGLHRHHQSPCVEPVSFSYVFIFVRFLQRSRLLAAAASGPSRDSFHTSRPTAGQTYKPSGDSMSTHKKSHSESDMRGEKEQEGEDEEEEGRGRKDG